jgi:hypothetical protein
LKLLWYVLGFACSVGGLERDGSRRPGGEPGSVKPDRQDEGEMSKCALLQAKQMIIAGGCLRNYCRIISSSSKIKSVLIGYEMREKFLLSANRCVVIS